MPDDAIEEIYTQGDKKGTINWFTNQHAYEDLGNRVLTDTDIIERLENAIAKGISENHEGLPDFIFVPDEPIGNMIATYGVMNYDSFSTPKAV